VNASTLQQWERCTIKTKTGGAALHKKLYSGDTCTALMPHNTCLADAMLHGDCSATTYELCSTLSTSKGRIKAIIEELSYSKVCDCLVS
jgi:hypothetical protein